MRSSKRIAIVAAVAVVAVAAAGFGVTKMLARPSAAAGSDCRKDSGDARTACYSKLLSARLVAHGVADAVAMLDALAAADPDVAEHAHEYSHGIGIEAYGRSTDIAGTFSACGDGFSSGCRSEEHTSELQSLTHLV